MQHNKPVVLVVDDDPLMRLMSFDLVEDEGFEALDAGTGAQALQLLERRSDIGVLVTDIYMPGEINGMQLAAHVFRRWPHIRIIGLSASDEPERIVLPPGSAFFSKPYSHDQVAATLHAMAV